MKKRLLASILVFTFAFLPMGTMARGAEVAEGTNMVIEQKGPSMWSRVSKTLAATAAVALTVAVVYSKYSSNTTEKTQSKTEEVNDTTVYKYKDEASPMVPDEDTLDEDSDDNNNSAGPETPRPLERKPSGMIRSFSKGTLNLVGLRTPSPETQVLKSARKSARSISGREESSNPEEVIVSGRGMGKSVSFGVLPGLQTTEDSESAEVSVEISKREAKRMRKEAEAEAKKVAKETKKAAKAAKKVAAEKLKEAISDLDETSSDHHVIKDVLETGFEVVETGTKVVGAVAGVAAVI